ncbi:MAG: 30S ribosomal protein S19e [Nanoarchaeota archaeon]
MIYNVSQQKLVLEVSQLLKEQIEMPEWARFVKTGPHRETLPKNPDWWYIRAASVLRTCYKQGPVGVSKLRTRYGGRKNRGFRPDMFQRSSGKIIRSILQQLESVELLKQEQIGVYKGRVATSKGASLLAKAASQVAKDTVGDN